MRSPVDSSNTDVDYLCADDENPLELFHGTFRDFTEFSDSFCNGLGFHFGCREQGMYFATRHGARDDRKQGRIIRVKLRMNRVANVGNNDAGWEVPFGVIATLYHAGFLTTLEAERLNGGEKLRFSESPWNKLGGNSAEKETRLAKLMEIVELMEAKGYSGITYFNAQEPPDGVRRRAWLVFRADQIDILSDERVCCKGNR